MSERYDIAVIGLGPAGATFARLAGERRRVIAIDKKDAPGGYAKPCGGLLSSDAQKALSMFDLTLPKDILVDPQIFSVKTIALDSGLIRHYQRFYLNLDRDRFDRWLIGMIPDGVERVDGVCTGVRRIGGGFAVEYLLDGQRREIEAKHVVGADGAASVVRGSLFPGNKPTYYVSIQQWFTEKHTSPFYSCIFDPETSDCCSWSISKDDRFIFGGAFPPQGCRERFERQKEKLAAYGFEFGEPLRTESCMVLRPRSPRDFCCGGGGAFLLGEAAGFISPSSLEGISWAINSARLLAERIGSASPDAAYRRATRGIRLRLMLKRLKCPFMYCPPLRRAVMASGIDSIDVRKAVKADD